MTGISRLVAAILGILFLCGAYWFFLGIYCSWVLTGWVFQVYFPLEVFMSKLFISGGAVLAVSLLAGFLTTISPWFLSIWFGLVSLVSLFLSLVVIGKGIILLVDDDEIEPK
jgi:hypothetical protein